MQTILSADTTRLDLLTRDGKLTVEFAPALEPKHYTELFDVVQDFDSELTARALVIEAARRWEREVDF